MTERENILLLGGTGGANELFHRLAGTARAHGLRLVTAHDAVEAVRVLDTEACAAIIIDGGVADLGAPELLSRLREDDPVPEVVLVAPPDTPRPDWVAALDVLAVLESAAEVENLSRALRRALDRRRMVVENRRLLWELHVVNEIAAGVTNSLDLAVVLQRALGRVMKLFHGEAALVRLREAHEKVFELRAQQGLTRPEAEALSILAVGGLPNDDLISSRVPIAIADLHDRRRLQSGPVNFDRLRAVMSVPILVGDDLVGILDLFSPAPGRFTPADQRLFLSIGRQLGVAVQNARLYARVRQGKLEWERTADAIGDPIAVFDSSRRLVRGNSALAALLQCPVTRLIGRTCADVGFCRHEDRDCAVERVIRSRTALREQLVRPNGQVLDVTTLPLSEGQPSAAVVQLAKDATEDFETARRVRAMQDELTATNASLNRTVEQLRTAQAQLIQSEKLSAIGQLVAGVAHELNNPLTSVIGYAQLVHEDLMISMPEATNGPRSDTQLAQDVQRISDEAERAAKIIRNLLAFARRQTGERALQNLEDLIAGVVSFRAYDLRVNNVEVRTEVAADLPPVFADANQLQQALLNLVLNAEQALEHSTAGILSVRARFDPAAGAVRIEVADNGPGIPPTVLPFIFDPFFTTKPVGKGTGLGLSICYGIVRDHGGSIWAENSEAGGARFIIELPVRLYEQLLTWAPLKVLVAHTDSTQREYLCAALSAWGHDPVPAVAGDAVNRFLRDPIDLALVDPRICAQDVAAWEMALAGRPGLPVVVTAAESDGGELVRLGRGRDLAHVAPPFQLVDLAAAIQDVIFGERH